jgi:transglutaminase-like putative cysteine protease
MLIRYGFDIEIEFSSPTSVLTMMDIHLSRSADIVNENAHWTTPPIAIETFTDSFGNLCRRFDAPVGRLVLQLEGTLKDSGEPDPVVGSAAQSSVSTLPIDALPFLMGSRYCETDLLGGFAWANFGHIQGGWPRVQAICDFVHKQLTFSYPKARSSRTAMQALEERSGVCRDFTHLAVTLCRCLNVPARYCNGYLGDIGVPYDPTPMDFNAWFEAFLDGKWYTFDARHNQPRFGRILISRGRDAADVAMISSFGRHTLTRFKVTTEEAKSLPLSVAA